MHIDENYFKNTVGLYIEGIKNDYSRYRSFDQCYFYFQTHYLEYQKDEVLDSMALHLFSYLASWGMMRSEILIQNNYLIHKKACAIIAEKMIQSGKDLSVYDSMELRDEIKEGYKGISYLKLSYDKVEKKCHMKTKNANSITDTFVTKIILGTTGLVPAYDRFVKRAMNEYRICDKFDSESLNSLIEFAETNRDIIYKIQRENDCVKNYPVMKIVDMFLWQKGFELDCASKNKTVTFSS